METIFQQPTTILGLASISIVAVVYVMLQFDKSSKSALGKFIQMLEAKDKNYVSYVEENNHKFTDLIVASTKAIENHTKVSEGLVLEIKKLRGKK